MTEAKGKSDKCQKADAERERERRRKRYKFALVFWSEWYHVEGQYAVEYKKVLELKTYAGTYKMICDDQPEKVLRGMLKLLKEGENEDE